MMLHGTIAEWEKVNSNDFSRAMNAALAQNATEVNLRVHSPGGNPFEGIAMGTKITEVRARGVKVTAHIEGLAASMMSAVVCFCDKVIIAKHARMMVHQSKGVAIGSAAQVIGYGNMMQTMNETLAEIYATKTGKEKKWVMENWMAEGKDKWFTDQEALESKLADQVSGETKVKAMSAEGGTYFQMAAHYDQFFNTEQNDFMKKEELIKFLGLKADATELEIATAMNEMKLKASATPAPTAPPAPAAPPAPVAAADAVVNGIVALAKARGISDEKQLNAIKALAAVNSQAAIDLIPAAPAAPGAAPATEAKAEAPKPISIAELMASMSAEKGGSTPDKANWGWKDWSKPENEKEFAALLEKEPKKFIALFKAEFNYEPSENELSGLVFKK
jgi:ATP-dependent protease ClpP protease subunit